MQPDHIEFLAALGKRLKGLRHERGWTLTDMMVLHGYADSHWRKYEGGKVGGLTVDTLLRLASVFGLSLVELLDGLGDFPKKTISSVERKAAVKTSARAARKTAAKKIATKTLAKKSSRVQDSAYARTTASA